MNTENIDNWSDCKLGRREQADLLTNFLMHRFAASIKRKKSKPNIVNTFSLNVDAPWGMGKTFFIDRWAKDLEDKNGHLTIKFDAWKHDYSKDAMSSLLASIYTQIEQHIQEDASLSRKMSSYLKTFKSSAFNILKKSAPLAISLASTATIGVPLGGFVKDPEAGQTDEAIEKIVGNVSSEMAKELFNRKVKETEALKAFKESVTAIMNKLEEEEKIKLPLFIFIDELDRCRPNFSIEILECVKHVFDIDNLYFIFTTDADQLQKSLEAVYGVNFSSERYFKRIFNRECSLEKPQFYTFSDFICSEEAGYISFDQEDQLLFPFDGQDIEESFKVAFSMICEAYDVDLRVQIACVEHIDMILGSDTDIQHIGFIIIHLTVLWHLEKNEALLQSNKSKTNPTLFKNNPMHGTELVASVVNTSHTEITIEDILNSHYKCLGANQKNIHEHYENNRTFMEVEIYRIMNRNIYDGNSEAEDEKWKIEFAPLMEQIQTMS